MGTDVSRAEVRTANQRRARLTDNRSSVLPGRRDTSMDRFVAASSMSSAQRGDGGAAELMRVLGLVNNAATDLQDYANGKFKKDEEDNAATGALDQAANQVDEAKAGRSYAYRNAVARGRTTTAWNTSLREFGDELRGVVEQQDQLTLEERQAEVRRRVNDFYEDFAIDPDTGKPRDFLATPDSMRYLAEQMGQSRPQFEAVTLARIEERFNEEAVGHFGAYVLNEAINLQPGGWLDLSTAGALLPPTVSDEDRKLAVMSTAKAAAEELRRQGRPQDGWRIYRQLLGVVPEVSEGIPSVLQTGPQPVDIPASEASKPAQPAPADFNMAAYMASTRGAESRGDDTAQAATSSAYGRYQFTKDTWRTLYKAEFGKTGETDAQILAKRADGAVQDKLMERLTRNNLAALKRAGIPASASSAYLAHFLGTKDAIRVLKAAPSTPIAEVVSAESIAANASVFRNATDAGKLISWAGRKQGASGDGSGAITPDDPVVANPNFIAPDAPLDPIDLAERDIAGSPPPPQLLAGMLLSPTERAQLTEASEQYAREVRSEWARDRRENEDRNADILSLRLMGQGDRITSQDVMAAVDRGDIRMDQARGLLDGLRQNAAMAERYQDGVEADADRAQTKRREAQAESLVAYYTGGLYSGRDTPAQARARVLRDAARITDPAVRSAVMAAVTEDANRIETLRANSAPFRQAMTRIDDEETKLLQKVTRPGTGGSAKQIGTILSNKFDIARKRAAERIADGENADTVYNEEMGKVAAEYVRLTKPRAAPSGNRPAK